MKNQTGFTLIELAIVLVIVTLLVGGLAMPLSAQIEARRISETKKTLGEARESILGYTMTHLTTSCTCVYTTSGLDASSTCVNALCPTSVSVSSGTVSLTLQPRHYLPCPDMKGDDPESGQDNDGDGTLTDLNNGLEDRYVNTTPGRCTATASTGNLPWVTLGTAEQDAWGNRLQYSVSANYAHSGSGFTNAFTGDRQICSTSTGGCASGTVARDVPAVVISFGPNGWGALNVNNSILANPTSNDELENININTAFVTRSPTKPGAAAGEFDDLVVWIPHPLLISRVCPTPGGCP